MQTHYFSFKIITTIMIFSKMILIAKVKYITVTLKVNFMASNGDPLKNLLISSQQDQLLYMKHLFGKNP